LSAHFQKDYEAKKQTLEDIFSCKMQYTIPKYQRGYDWKVTPHISDFWNDIMDSYHSDERKMLFLGTYITRVIDTAEDQSYQISEIIDGQQRLTTLFIFYIAMKAYASNSNWEENDRRTAVTIIQEDLTIRRMSMMGEKQINRLIPSSTISTVYKNMTEHSWDGYFDDKINGKSIKRQNNIIKPIYEKFYTFIDGHCKNDFEIFRRLHTHCKNNVSLLNIDISSEAAAFEVFERTNARGKSLEISDLLKNYLFSQQKEYEADISVVWNDITKKSGTSILKMLKYYYVSRLGYVTKNDLYRAIKIRAQEIGINDFVNELLRFAVFYEAYNSDESHDFIKWLAQESLLPNDKGKQEEYKRIMEAFKFFQIQQIIPVIFSFLTSYKKVINDNNELAKRFFNFFRKIEVFHLENTKLTTSIGNKFEKKYAEISKNLFTTETPNKVIVDALNWIKNDGVTDNAIRAGIMDLRYDNKGDKKTIKYLQDFIVNHKVDSGQRIVIYEHLKKGEKPKYNIDHIYSRNACGRDNIEDEYEHGIGNLIPIPTQLNSVFGDKSFLEKKEMLSNPEVRNEYKIGEVHSYITELYTSYSDWGIKEINERAEEWVSKYIEARNKRHSYKNKKPKK